jgi:hypothetical protein
MRLEYIQRVRSRLSEDINRGTGGFTVINIILLFYYFSSVALLTFIRSNTMSHITLKMCQFVLIVHLRDYHNNVMVLLWCSSTYLYYISKFMSD